MPYSSVSLASVSPPFASPLLFLHTFFFGVFFRLHPSSTEVLGEQRTDFWPECRSMLLCLNIIKYHLTPLSCRTDEKKQRGREEKKRREKKFTWDSKWSELFFCFCSIFIHDIVYIWRTRVRYATITCLGEVFFPSPRRTAAAQTFHHFPPFLFPFSQHQMLAFCRVSSSSALLEYLVCSSCAGKIYEWRKFPAPTFPSSSIVSCSSFLCAEATSKIVTAAARRRRWQENSGWRRRAKSSSFHFLKFFTDLLELSFGVWDAENATRIRLCFPLMYVDRRSRRLFSFPPFSTLV